MALHDTEELHDDLGGRSNKDLTLSPAFGIDNIVLRWCNVRNIYISNSGLTTHEAVVLDIVREG